MAYISDGKVVGLSKKSHVVNAFFRRLQVQKYLALEACNRIHRTLIQNEVVIKAYYMCMQMRGFRNKTQLLPQVDL